MSEVLVGDDHYTELHETLANTVSPDELFPREIWIKVC